MVQMTVEVPDEVAATLRSAGPWLPSVLELSLGRYQTQAVAVVTEVIEFLSTNPTPTSILDYHVSEQAQLRLRRLLALNEAGLLNEDE